jgi:hypothetical protein
LSSTSTLFTRPPPAFTAERRLDDTMAAPARWAEAGINQEPCDAAPTSVRTRLSTRCGSGRASKTGAGRYVLDAPRVR